MLPDRLLSYERTSDGRIVPRWLHSRDEVWLRELAIEASAAAGRAVGEVDDRLVDSVARRAREHGISRRVVEAVWAVERKRWTTTIDSPVAPEQLRRIVFDLAAERSSSEAIATAAAEVGIPEELIRGKLFADRAKLRVLTPPATPTPVAELASSYNLALVRALAVRSTELTATVREHARRPIGYAKLLRLMVVVEDRGGGAIELRLSGPLALFHETTKYGRALATWLPALTTTSGWRMSACVILRGERLRLDLDATAPVARTHDLPKAFDSKVEAALDRDLRRLGTSWHIERESAVVRAGSGRLFYPDFALVRGGRRVLVEVVGFWTPEYLAEKLRMRDAAAHGSTPLVLCVEERAGRAAFDGQRGVVFFRRRIDAKLLSATCEAALAAASPSASPALAEGGSTIAARTYEGEGARELDRAGSPGNVGLSRQPAAGLDVRPASGSPTAPRRHYLVLPTTQTYQSYAILAGASREDWRSEILADIVRDAQVKVAPLAPIGATENALPRVASPSAALVGERFVIIVGRDRLRSDGLFVFRIERAPVRPRWRTLAEARVLLFLASPGAALLRLKTLDPVHTNQGPAEGPHRSAWFGQSPKEG